MIYEARSEARNATASATSSHRAKTLLGDKLYDASLTFCGKTLVNSVGM